MAPRIWVKTWITAAIILAVSAAPPDQVDTPSISSVTETSFAVGFTGVENATKYYITINARYSTTSSTIETNNTNVDITGLTGSTLYDVTVRGENDAGEIGNDSNPASQQTYPEAPTLRLSIGLPNSIFIFPLTRNYARVSQWTFEYRIFGSESITSVTSSQYYVFWLTGLEPNTQYQVRGRASQILPTTVLSEADVRFSDWYNFTTDLLSVFGRVNFVNTTYENGTEGSDDWNRALEDIRNAYPNVQSNRISIVSIADNFTVHYEIKVENKTLPTGLDFLLTGAEFTNAAINDGDRALGETNVQLVGDTRYNFFYDKGNPNRSELGLVADKFMVVTPEQSPSVEIYLNTDTSESTPVVEEYYLNIDGLDLENNVDDTLTTVPSNSVVGFAPKLLTRDLMRNQTNELLYDLRYEVLQFFLDETKPTPTLDHFIFTSELMVSLPSATYSTACGSTSMTSVTMNIPAVEKAIRYEILDGTTPVATTEEENIDGSETIKITVLSLTNGTEYSFSLRVTTRNHDNTTTVATSASSVTVVPWLCSSCETNSTGQFCTCNDGFEGDGFICNAIITTTTPDSTTQTITTPDPTTQPITTSQPTIQSTATPEPTTQSITTPEPTTQSPTTLEPTTQSTTPTTPDPTTQSTATPEPTTQSITTPEPTTQSPTTLEPTTQSTTSTTPQPTTQSTATPEPTTQSITTPEPTTQSPTTPDPTTESTSTSEPTTTPDLTTQSSTAPETTTQSTTAPDPTTQSTTVPGPTTQSPTTPGPTTQSTTILEPTTQYTTTLDPTTLSTSAPEPTTIPDPTTQSTTTPEPTTQSTPDTTSQLSTTPEPTTQSTTTPDPTTQSTTTPEPTSQSITTPESTTQSTTNAEITTLFATTLEPTTQSITTLEPTTQSTTNPGPTTTTPESPQSTSEPTTQPATTSESTATTADAMLTTTASVCNGFNENSTFTVTQEQASASSFTLRWTIVTTASEYRISLRCTGCENETLETTRFTEMAFDGLEAGRDYTACVTFDVCDGRLTQSRTECRNFFTTPAAVSSVELQIGAIVVVFTWQAVEGADAYDLIVTNLNLARAAQSRPWQTETVSTSETSYRFSNLASSTPYSFSIRARNSAGSSSPYERAFNTLPTTTTSAANTTTVSTTTITSRTTPVLSTTGASTPTPSTTGEILTMTSSTSAATSQYSTVATTGASTTEVITKTDTTSETVDETTIQTTEPTLPNTTSSSAPTIPTQNEETSVPDIRIGGLAPWWFIFVMVLAALIIIIAIAAIVIWCKRNTRKYKLPANSEEDVRPPTRTNV